jgi:hypothetical protein
MDSVQDGRKEERTEKRESISNYGVLRKKSLYSYMSRNSHNGRKKLKI